MLRDTLFSWIILIQGLFSNCCCPMLVLVSTACVCRNKVVQPGIAPLACLRAVLLCTHRRGTRRLNIAQTQSHQCHRTLPPVREIPTQSGARFGIVCCAQPINRSGLLAARRLGQRPLATERTMVTPPFIRSSTTCVKPSPSRATSTSGTPVLCTTNQSVQSVILPYTANCIIVAHFLLKTTLSRGNLQNRP